MLVDTISASDVALAVVTEPERHPELMVG